MFNRSLAVIISVEDVSAVSSSCKSPSLYISFLVSHYICKLILC